MCSRNLGDLTQIITCFLFFISPTNNFNKRFRQALNGVAPIDQCLLFNLGKCDSGAGCDDDGDAVDDEVDNGNADDDIGLAFIATL